ncbi:hypothetical protein GCM10022214_37720 [Actinomadura miaoliensis]|uniref:Transposase n=1 Tax=Actinomadura miaoliensis TaxID=430685 RepID=A0ABP7VXU7_9ACTN
MRANALTGLRQALDLTGLRQALDGTPTAAAADGRPVPVAQPKTQNTPRCSSQSRPETMASMISTKTRDTVV